MLARHTLSHTLSKSPFAAVFAAPAASFAPSLPPSSAQSSSPRPPTLCSYAPVTLTCGRGVERKQTRWFVGQAVPAAGGERIGGGTRTSKFLRCAALLAWLYPWERLLVVDGEVPTANGVKRQSIDDEPTLLSQAGIWSYARLSSRLPLHLKRP
jgi:hypothetical protein